MAETAIKDIILVHIDNKPTFYARIEDISPDIKPGWWHVKLLVLAFPLQVFTWTLDSSQVNGEPFTMGGTPVRLERVVAPVADGGSRGAEDESRETMPKEEKGSGKVVSLAERKKKE